MSVEELLITEKYINKLRNINGHEKHNYDEIYYQVISKYIFNKSIKLTNNSDPIILSDSYFSKFRLNEDLPFIIQTELEHELMDVDYLNQKIINQKIRDIKKSYLEELATEEKNRSKLNDGEIFERNAMLLEQFKKEFGYDPFFQKSKKSDVLDIQMSDDEYEQDSSAIKSKKKSAQKNHHVSRDESIPDDNVVETEDTNSEVKNKTDNKLDGIPSLEILNNIIEVLNMDFNNIIGDIIDKDNRPPCIIFNKEKVRKPRMTKKAKEEELKNQQELEVLLANQNSDQEIIKGYIKLANKLADSDIKSPQNKDSLENGVKAALQLAQHYDSGEKIIGSGIKANMIYIFLIKKFNAPDAMFMLGQNLLVGNCIVKNFLHGAKLIKVAAEKYKHKNAIIKLKSMTKVDFASRTTEDQIQKNEKYNSESSD